LSRIPNILIPLTSLAALASPAEATTKSLRLFLDVQQTDVDFRFLKTQLMWVDWVRDRVVAQVHLILTESENGGGGRHLTLRFVGLEQFKGLDDEMVYSATAVATPDDFRKGLASMIALGLARYAARLPESHRMSLTLSDPGAAQTQTRPEKDPWNAWVYSVGGNTFMSGESKTEASTLGINLNASRITEDRILRFGASGNWNRSRYDLSNEVLRSSSRSTYGSGVFADALSQHWTWGVMGSASTSAQANIASSFRIAPAIEFNVWKYSEFSQRQLTFLYQVGLWKNRYVEETVFGKIRETQADNSITASLDLNQPWGTINTSASASAFAKDWTKNSLMFSGSVNVKLTQGLSLNFFGDWSRVHNQLSLPKEGATDDEILLRLKVLQTSYRYFTSVGISYTFGSIFNNAVNSRFRNTGGRAY